jgi:carbonic anhydrase
MKKILSALLIACTLLTTQHLMAHTKYFVTKSQQQALTPEQVLKKLEQGNIRYIDNKPRNYNENKLSILGAKYGQAPYAIILGCIDSRSTPNIVFDQPTNSLFVTRIAGNPVSTDVLGGMEYATEYTGTKLIVIMGHTHCGAITGACKGINKPSQLNALLKTLEPAVRQIAKESKKPLDCQNPNTINEIVRQNVLDQMQNTLTRSTSIAQKIKSGNVMLVGAVHDIDTGKVNFFNIKGQPIQ